MSKGSKTAKGQNVIPVPLVKVFRYVLLYLFCIHNIIYDYNISIYNGISCFKTFL